MTEFLQLAVHSRINAIYIIRSRYFKIKDVFMFQFLI